ncbi:MauE/DoxX family redox-associated membrane protein [Micromonospora rubida]|uniref:MauE/DoxX family redox-associated membrane protein n=1 Tax=Micromonospora rubida TaxID=2697657 RepID=A0ABW7SIW4_9ACTN
MWYVVIGFAGLIATVFVAAVAGKVHSRSSFESFTESVLMTGVVPVRWGPPASVLAVTAEAGVPLLLAAAPVLVLAGAGAAAGRLAVIAGLALALLLLATLTAVVAVTLRRGVRAPCRCFGSGDKPLRGAHIVRNLLLLSVAGTGLVTASVAGPTGATVPAGAVLAALGGALLAGGFVIFDDLVDLFAPAPLTVVGPSRRSPVES